MNIKDRVELVVTLKSEYRYASNYGYKPQTMSLYNMQDEDGNVYVWRTAGVLGRDTEDGYEVVNRDDKIRIKATIKKFSEYKGTQQTEVTRVVVLDVLDKALTKAQKDALRREEQLASLESGDHVWTMPYRQYKEHYSDCETLAGSYTTYDNPYGHVLRTPTIDVIIKAGRLKNSGTRGRRFGWYDVRFVMDGKDTCTCYKAICGENAVKRAMKEYPNGSGFKYEELH